MKFRSFIRISVLPVFLVFSAMGGMGLKAENTPGGIAPRSLMPENQSSVTSDGDNPQVQPTLGKDGISVVIQSGSSSYPGVVVVPSQGKTWDLSAFGHVEAKVTNTGDKLLSYGVRVDNDGDWHESPWNTEMGRVKPGESQTIKVYFGYAYGGKPSFKLNSGAVTRLLFMTGKVTATTSFRIDEIWASGSTGEKPPVDPNTVRIKPVNGVVFDAKAAPDTRIQQTATKGGVTFKPLVGAWNLSEYTEVKVKIKNTGSTPITPNVHLTGNGSTDTIAAKSPVPPNGEVEITVPFAQSKPTEVVEKSPGKYEPKPGTGTTFASNNVRAIGIFSDSTATAGVQVVSITADAVPTDVPDWVGKKPPGDGDWVKTFDDEFDGSSIDLKKWNIYAANFWDKRTHFTKDDIIVKDGKAILHYEKKTGFHNDDPKQKETNYACGFADTFGKWTQRYGYFEARVKLPTAPGLWPAFWLMPDRGMAAGPQWKRASTSNGGMEFDIMEFLSGWGPYRYNIANHWDGYGKEHKANGSTCTYVQADKDGYITSGLLWTPGKVVYYCNGKELLEWENPRVSSVASNIILDVVSGGWDNLPLDDAKLPDDFVVDYIRVWQRKDLASDVDGPKPNDGGPAAPAPAAAASPAAK